MQENQESKENIPYIEEDEMDLLELLGVLFRYRWLIIVTTLLGVIGSVGFSIISIILPPEVSPLPNKYKSSALILKKEENPGGVASRLASSGLGSLAELA